MINNTRFGFIWNNLHVERCSEDKRNGVYLYLSTGKQQTMIRVTPGGKIKLDEVEKIKRK